MLLLCWKDKHLDSLEMKQVSGFKPRSSGSAPYQRPAVIPLLYSRRPLAVLHWFQLFD